MQIDIVNLEGQKVGQMDLADEVFATKVKESLLWEVVKAQQAAKRAGTHSTKTRRVRAWRRQEAVPAEGDRQRSPGLDALAQLRRRRQGVRTASARLRVHRAEEGEEGRARVARSRCAPRRRSWWSSTSCVMEAPKSKRIAAVLKTLGFDSALVVDAKGNVNLVEVDSQPDGARLSAARGPERLRHPEPRRPGHRQGRGQGGRGARGRRRSRRPAA